jgi:nicotinamidase-related amidase
MLGARPVLLFVDVQRGFDEPSWGRRHDPDREARIGELLAAWRATDRLTIHAEHCSTESSSTLRPRQSGDEREPCSAGDGSTYPAEQIHAIALADLHAELATIVDAETVIAEAS